MNEKNHIDPRGPRFGAGITTVISLLAFAASLEHAQVPPTQVMLRQMASVSSHEVPVGWSVSSSAGRGLGGHASRWLLAHAHGCKGNSAAAAARRGDMDRMFMKGRMAVLVFSGHSKGYSDRCC